MDRRAVVPIAKEPTLSEVKKEDFLYYSFCD
jgi:hypothetical protein